MNEQYSRDEGPQSGGYTSDYQQSASRYAAYSAQSNAGESLFDSLRRSEVRRNNDRMVGGILSGVSARYGWDLTLLRVLTAVLALFFPLALAVYAVAWMLLPEESDGRIHLEALTLGYFNVAHLGGAAMLLVGLTSTALFGTLVFLIGLPFVLVLGLVLIINGRSQPPAPPTHTNGAAQTSAASPDAWQNLANMRNSAPTGQGGTPSGSAPAGEDTPTAPLPQDGASDENGDEATSSSHDEDADSDVTSQETSGDWRTLGGPQQGSAATGYQSASPLGAGQGPSDRANASAPATPLGAPATTAAWASQPSYGAPRPVNTPEARVPIRKRPLPLWANLLVTGLLILIFAGTELLLYYEEFNLHAVAADYGRIILIAGGICLLLVAIPLIYAALADRGAAWLISLSIVGMLIAPPTTLLGVALQSEDFGPRSFSRVADLATPWGEHTDIVQYDSSVTNLGSVINAHWDLSDVPNEEPQVFTVQTSLGDLTIYIRQGQSVQVNVSEHYGTINASYQPGSLEWMSASVGMVSGSWTTNSSGAPPSTIIDIHRSLGTLTIVELPAHTPVKPIDQPAPQPAIEAPQSTPAQDAPQSTPAQGQAPADQPASANRR